MAMDVQVSEFKTLISVELDYSLCRHALVVEYLLHSKGLCQLWIDALSARAAQTKLPRQGDYRICHDPLDL